MGILTKEYSLSAKEDLNPDRQRHAMESFKFSLEVAISSGIVFGECKVLNYLPINMIYPEHNEFAVPLLITPQLENGSTISDLKKEDNLRRIYQIGRTSLAIRCIPDFVKQSDELQFIFRGMYNRDVKNSVRAIENLVKKCDSKENPCLEWYEQ